MKKVIIASQNPVKINAVKIGFELMFADQSFEFIGVSVDSGVSAQPFGSAETFAGAKNRVDNASHTGEADFYVGIEGGITLIDNGGIEEMEAFAWVVIKGGDDYGKAKTASFFLPKPVVAGLKQGKELGEVNDIVFHKNNSKQKNGAVGILTNDVIDRTKYYSDAVVLALIPFKNKDIY